VLRVFQPLLQGKIINYFTAKKSDRDEQATLLNITYLIICTVAVVALTHHTTLLSQQIGMRLRIACSSLIYRKVHFNNFEFEPIDSVRNKLLLGNYSIA